MAATVHRAWDHTVDVEGVLHSYYDGVCSRGVCGCDSRGDTRRPRHSAHGSTLLRWRGNAQLVRWHTFKRGRGEADTSGGSMRLLYSTHELRSSTLSWGGVEHA